MIDSDPRSALTQALPRAVNFRVPVALPVRSAMWGEIAADILAALSADGWRVEREDTPGRRFASKVSIRKAITDAYYDARNAGQTMETAADNATQAVYAALRGGPDATD